MNITETIDNIVQYIIKFIEKIKGYVDIAIDFFTDLKDRIEGLLEYIEEKLESIGGFIEELNITTKKWLLNYSKPSSPEGFFFLVFFSCFNHCPVLHIIVVKNNKYRNMKKAISKILSAYRLFTIT